jgi:hypothetical protein
MCVCDFQCDAIVVPSATASSSTRTHTLSCVLIGDTPLSLPPPPRPCRRAQPPPAAWAVEVRLPHHPPPPLPARAARDGRNALRSACATASVCGGVRACQSSLSPRLCVSLREWDSRWASDREQVFPGWPSWSARRQSHQPIVRQRWAAVQSLR